MDTKHTVITIGREFGSGGREIGQLLASKLGIAFYDKEILNRAAQESGICKELFEHHDEKATPSYLYPMSAGMAMGMTMPLNHRIFMAQFDAISKLAAEGPCVIVGRCADYVLKNDRHVVNVFLYAGLAARVSRVERVYGVSAEQAKDMIKKNDKQRQTYYNFFAEGNWGQRCNYDLMIRTDDLAPEAVARQIIAYVEALRQK